MLDKRSFTRLLPRMGIFSPEPRVEEVELLALGVDEAQAVVVALLLEVGELGAVAVDDVEEGLDAGVDAGVGRVRVELEDEEGLHAHHPLDVVEDEGVGRAGEVGDVGDVDVGLVLDEGGGLEVLLAVVPVHVGEDRLVLEGQEVEGDDRVAARGELARDAHVRVGGVGVVGPPEQRDDGLVGLARLVEGAPAELGGLLEVVLLLARGEVEGALDLGRRRCRAARRA